MRNISNIFLRPLVTRYKCPNVTERSTLSPKIARIKKSAVLWKKTSNGLLGKTEVEIQGIKNTNGKPYPKRRVNDTGLSLARLDINNEKIAMHRRQAALKIQNG
jgi:hypothetical protein